MLKIVYTLLMELHFWLSLAADALFIISVIFSLVYALSLAASSLPPFRGRWRPNGWALPLLFCVSAALLFTPFGEIIAASLNSVVGGLAVDFWLDGGKIPFQINIIAALWAVGWVISLARFIPRRRLLLRRLNALHDAPDDAAFSAASARLSMAGARLKEMGGAPNLSPFSWGLFRPSVAVPAGFTRAFAYNERYAIYLHELTHLKKRDSLKYGFIGCLQAFFWFNPVVALAFARYKNHLEIACDRAVISQNALSSLEYARLLVRAMSASAPAPAFSNTYGDISRRLGYIFGDAKMIPVMKDRLVAAISIAALALGVWLVNPAFAGFPQAPDYPPKEVTAPDGKEAVIVVRFQWQGALGGYMIGGMEKME